VLVVSAGLLTVAAARSTSASELELALAEFLNRFPDGLSGLVTFLLRFGSLWVAIAAAALGWLARRHRLSLELLIAGGTAWLIGRVLVWVYGERMPPPGIVARGSGLQQFPLVRVAVAAAVVAAAAPYLTRVARRIGWGVVGLMSFSVLYVGSGQPNDIAAGLVLGVAVAAAVHLLFGSPAGRPSLEQIADALDELELTATELRFAPEQERGRTVFVATAADGHELRITAYGRDERDAQLLSKIWRFVWYEDSGPTLHVTRLQQVEHQAYAMLVAQEGGVAVPKVLAATTAGPGTAVLVERRSRATRLSEIDPSALTDRVLDAAWQAVVRLRRARVAHGAIDLNRLWVDDDGNVAIVDFGIAATSARGAQLDADAARLLAATGVVVGPDRAIAAAIRALGHDGLAPVLPYLQPPVLPDSVRHAVRRRDLDGLRSAGATAADVEPPPLAQLERVQARTVVFAALTFVGIYAALGQLGSFASLHDEIRGAEWGWLGVAVALAALTNIGYALGYVGSTTARLPFGRTIVLQTAGSFTNVATPNAIGTAALNARFHQVRGVPIGAAVAALFVNTVGSAIAQLLLFVAVLPAAGARVDLGLIPWRGVLAVGLLVVMTVVVVGAVIWRVPRFRELVVERARPGVASVLAVARSPSKLTLLLGGQLLVQVLYAMALGVCCRAFGAAVPLSSLLMINIGSSAISGLVPAPGGLGVAEATLAGALAATGVPSTVSIAAALTYRFLTTWLPALPGWIALRALQRGEDV
jgi:uncharacterized membrane protein YbhN (UPF0104 family)